MRSTLLNSRVRTGFFACLISTVAALSAHTHAGIIDWTITGPGSLSETNSSAVESDLQYNLAASGEQAWSITGVADTAGDYTFDWNYSGFHSWFMVTAFLNAVAPSGTTTLLSVGPVSCCDGAPSGGFGYSSTHTFSGLQAGDTVGFNLGGRHFDTANAFNGSLRLTQTSNASVPEPTALMLLAIGLFGLGVARRRLSE